MSVRSVRSARLRLACVAALVALTAAAASARAARRPVLVIDGTADGAAADAVAPLEAQLAREDKLGPVAVDVAAALRTPTLPADDWATVGQPIAAAALDEARAAFARFDHRAAADRAHGALDQLAAYADVAAARKSLAELALIEGQALVRAGDSARAELVLRLVHRFEPGRTLDPARYLPEVITAYLVAGRPAAATARIFITATGATEILIDGVAVGSERRTFDVTPGPHLIAARGEAILTIGRRIDAPADQEIIADLVPKKAPTAVRMTRVVSRLRAALDDVAIQAAVADLVALAQAHDAVILVHAEQGLAVRYHTPRGRLSRVYELGDPEQVIARLRPLAAKPIGPTGPIVPPVPTEPWYRQRWGKASIVATVGVIVGGVVAAMVIRDQGSSTLVGKADVD